MLRPHLLSNLLLSLALTLGACGGEEETSTQLPQTPLAAPAQAIAGSVPVAPADTVAPPDAVEPANLLFSFSIHPSLGGDSALPSGAPLLVQCMLFFTGEEAATLALEDGQPWTQAIGLTLFDDKGQAVPLEWMPLGGNPAASLLFTPEAAEISTVMALEPATLEGMPAGKYRLEAALSTRGRAAAGAWEGKVQASAVILELSVKPPAANGQNEAYRDRLLARWHQLSGRLEEALAQLDTALQRWPADIQLLSDRSEVLLELGQSDEAAATLQKAITAYYSDVPDPSHPPRWLLHRLRELDAISLAAADTQPTTLASLPQENAPAADDTAALPANTSESAQLAAAPVAKLEAAVEQTLEGTVIGARSWLGDQSVAFDPNGQWAVSARAGSEYGPVQNSAARATGAPDVPGTDDHPNAWCPAVRDSGTDWLEVSFERAAPATEVRVRQNYGPGAIVKVEAIDTDGQLHLWWEGIDPYGQEGYADDAVWFSVRVPRTDYAVQKIRLTLNLSAHGRWKQIDAVQLIDASR